MEYTSCAALFREGRQAPVDLFARMLVNDILLRHNKLQLRRHLCTRTNFNQVGSFRALKTSPWKVRYNHWQSSTANDAPGLYFNVNGGYMEGIVRGYRNALLTGTNYGNVRLPLTVIRASN